MSKVRKKKKNKSIKIDSLNALYRKRDRALERVVEIFEKGEDLGKDDLNRALPCPAFANVRRTRSVTANPISRNII